MPNLDVAAPLIAEGLYSYQIGGSERVGADLARAFAARGYRVLCFAYHDSDGPVRSGLEAAGIECLDMNFLRRVRWIRRVTYPLEMLRLFRRRGIQVLHVHHATALTLCGAAARLAGVRRVVMTEHALHQLLASARYRRQAIRDCRFATQVTGVHEGITRYFGSELRVPAERLQVIANGVQVGAADDATRRRVRGELGLSSDRFAVLFAGRLEAVKGLDTLLAAVASFAPAARARMTLLLAGDGSQRSDLTRLARDLAIDDNVRFLGARSDVPRLLSAADGFVMSSVTEGQPMALMEAMAADVPCVATAVGGIPELLADDCGLLVEPSSPQVLAAAMMRLMDDAALRTRLVASASRRVRARHDLDRVVTRYLELFGLPPHWRRA